MGFIQVYNDNLKHVATKDRKEVFMSPYANLRGNSPVVGYEIEATRITVWFKGGKPYSYSYNKAGRGKRGRNETSCKEWCRLKCIYYTQRSFSLRLN